VRIAVSNEPSYAMKARASAFQFRLGVFTSHLRDLTLPSFL